MDQAITEAGELPYWQQGDATMYSPQKLEERYRLRRRPEMLEELHLYWTTMLRSAFFSKVVDLESVIDKTDYVRFVRKLYKVMAPPESFDDIEATTRARADWERDSKGEGILTRKHFGDAMFELADMWVDGLEADHYVAFLERLFDQIAEGPVGSDRRTEWHWKDDADIHHSDFKGNAVHLGSSSGNGNLDAAEDAAAADAADASSQWQRKGGDSKTGRRGGEPSERRGVHEDSRAGAAGAGGERLGSSRRSTRPSTPRVSFGFEDVLDPWHSNIEPLAEHRAASLDPQTKSPTVWRPSTPRMGVGRGMWSAQPSKWARQHSLHIGNKQWKRSAAAPARPRLPPACRAPCLWHSA